MVIAVLVTLNLTEIMMTICNCKWSDVAFSLILLVATVIMYYRERVALNNIDDDWIRYQEEATAACAVRGSIIERQIASECMAFTNSMEKVVAEEGRLQQENKEKFENTLHELKSRLEKLKTVQDKISDAYGNAYQMGEDVAGAHGWLSRVEWFDNTLAVKYKCNGESGKQLWRLHLHSDTGELIGDELVALDWKHGRFYGEDSDEHCIFLSSQIKNGTPRYYVAMREDVR